MLFSPDKQATLENTVNFSMPGRNDYPSSGTGNNGLTHASHKCKFMEKQQGHTEIIDKILSGARSAVILRLIGQVVSWASTIIVVRFISPADYGLNAMLEAPLELLMLVSA